jgi:flagellar basal-body rod protein FlgG
MSNAALNVARTGLDAQAERMRVIANNLANVNTTAYQRERAEFQTLSYQTLTTPGAASAGENRYAIGLSLGSGVQMTGVARMNAQGALNSTENPYDLAIQGEGFFQIQRPDGTTA